MFRQHVGYGYTAASFVCRGDMYSGVVRSLHERIRFREVSSQASWHRWRMDNWVATSHCYTQSGDRCRIYAVNRTILAKWSTTACVGCAIKRLGLLIGCSLLRLQAYTFVVCYYYYYLIISRKRLLHSCQNYWADQDETLQRCRPWSPTMLVFFRIWKLFTVCPLGGQEILTFLAFEGASA